MPIVYPRSPSIRETLERTFRVRFETDVKFDIDVSVTSRPRKPLRGTPSSRDTQRFKSSNKRATMHRVLYWRTMNKNIDRISEINSRDLSVASVFPERVNFRDNMFE